MLVSYDDGPNPKVFVLHPNLFMRVPASHTNHRAADLQMGDVVSIRVTREPPDVEYCYEVSIYRRPGGLVPPSIWDEGVKWEWRWDTIQNARQAAEEKALVILRHLGVWYFR
ncbi:MAG: hypothetical protein C0501_15995 [Isosphaera sp.]|nr:hypothetical protein [Isosphaera sp.]